MEAMKPDLTAKSLIVDPYPVYRALQMCHPVYWCKASACWYVSRYADVAKLLQDPRFSSNRLDGMPRHLTGSVQSNIIALIRELSRWVLFRDPPDHGPVRRAIVRALATRTLFEISPMIRSVTDELIDSIASRKRLDLVREIASPLPAIVMAELLGAAQEDRAQIAEWSKNVAGFFGTQPSATQMYRARNAFFNLSFYFQQILKGQRRRPTSDLLTGLIRIQKNQREFSNEDLVANCVMLMFAGHETTTSLIGNGMLAMLRHPAQQHALRQNPVLINSAVVECMRYDSPIQRVGRVARENVSIGDHVIQRGQYVYALLGAANRDPSIFPEPDVFYIGRQDAPNLALGFGPHYCAGAALGRLQVSIVLQRLLTRLPDLRLAFRKPRWQPNHVLRGLESMPVRPGNARKNHRRATST